jgi:hypothetical protein
MACSILSVPEKTGGNKRSNTTRSPALFACGDILNGTLAGFENAQEILTAFDYMQKQCPLVERSSTMLALRRLKRSGKL